VEYLDVRAASTDFPKAIELVRAIAGDLPNTHLFLLSDGAFDSLPAEEAPGVDFSYIKIGARARNVGITALDARRSVQDWDKPQVFVRVENFSEDEASVRLDLYLNETLFDARAIVVPAGQSGSAVFTDPGLTEGLVRVALNDKDDLAVDDEAWIVLTEPKQSRVLIVTEGNYFLELAAQKDPLCSATFMTPEEYDADARSGAFAMTDYDMAILDRHVPKTLPAGAYVFLDALPPLEGFDFEADAENPVVVDWDSVHPMNQYMSYANLFIEETMKFSGPTDAVTLVDSDAGPLVLWWSSPKYRVLVVGFVNSGRTCCLVFAST